MPEQFFHWRSDLMTPVLPPFNPTPLADISKRLNTLSDSLTQNPSGNSQNFPKIQIPQKQSI